MHTPRRAPSDAFRRFSHDAVLTPRPFRPRKTRDHQHRPPIAAAKWLPHGSRSTSGTGRGSVAPWPSAPFPLRQGISRWITGHSMPPTPTRRTRPEDDQACEACHVTPGTNRPLDGRCRAQPVMAVPSERPTKTVEVPRCILKQDPSVAVALHFSAWPRAPAPLRFSRQVRGYPCPAQAHNAYGPGV